MEGEERATEAMAFMGCTGSGRPKRRPEKMLARPEKMRVEEGEVKEVEVRAMKMGMKVERSPREPEISRRGRVRMVWMLCWVVARRWERREEGRDEGEDEEEGRVKEVMVI